MAVDGGASLGFIAKHLMCQLGEFVPLVYGISYIGGWFMVIGAFVFLRQKIDIEKSGAGTIEGKPKYIAFFIQLVIGFSMIHLSDLIRSMAMTVYGPGHESFIAFCGA